MVSLIESDDSDSDVDSGDAGQSVFGGLEFMIKEARRTAEVNATLSVTDDAIGTKHMPLNRLYVCLGIQAQICHKLREGEQPRQNPGGSA